MENIKDKLLFFCAILIVGLLCLINFKGCNNPKIHTSSDTIKVTEHTTDTVKIPVEKIIYRTKYKPFETFVDSKKDTTRLYSDTTVFKEQGASISVIRRDSVGGVLLGSSTKIQAVIPKIIDSVKTTITITKHDSIILPPKFAIWGGLDLGGNTTSISNISPAIGLQFKNKQYFYKYNIIDKSHNVGIYFKLF